MEITIGSKPGDRRVSQRTTIAKEPIMLISVDVVQVEYVVGDGVVGDDKFTPT
jgi:hypothetical protein